MQFLQYFTFLYFFPINYTILISRISVEEVRFAHAQQPGENLGPT